jgi:hypothetical protein
LHPNGLRQRDGRRLGAVACGAQIFQQLNRFLRGVDSLLEIAAAAT